MYIFPMFPIEINNTDKRNDEGVKICSPSMALNWEISFTFYCEYSTGANVTMALFAGNNAPNLGFDCPMWLNDHWYEEEGGDDVIILLITS